MRIEKLFSDHAPLNQRNIESFLELLNSHADNSEIMHGIKLSLLVLGYKVIKKRGNER